MQNSEKPVLTEPYDAELDSLPQDKMRPFSFGGRTLMVYNNEETQKPKLLFIHGFNYFTQMYASMVNTLAKQFHVLSVDLPGHGLSGGFDSYPLQLFIDALEAAVKHFNFDRFVTVGHSMGGLLAICMHARLPGSTHCVSFCPAGLKTVVTSGQKMMQSKCIAAMLCTGAMVNAYKTDAYNRSGRLFPKERWEIAWNTLTAVINQDQDKLCHRIVDQVQNFPWDDCEQEFKAAGAKGSTLVVFATNDSYIDTNYSVEHAQKIAGLKTVLEQGIHELPILRPQWALEQIQKFVQ